MAGRLESERAEVSLFHFDEIDDRSPFFPLHRGPVEHPGSKSSYPSA